MKANIIISAIIGLFLFGAVSNINAQKNTIYRSVDENKELNCTTVSLYKGEKEKNLVPLRRYVIFYSENNLPTEKIIYEWDAVKKDWVENIKYEYFLYDTDSRPNILSYSEGDNGSERWKDEPKYSVNLFSMNKELMAVSE